MTSRPPIRLQLVIGEERWPSTLTAAEVKRAVNTVGTASLETELPTGPVPSLDYRDEARVLAVHGDAEEVLMTGVVTSVAVTAGTMKIELRDAAAVLEEQTAAGAIHNVPQPEALSFILTVSGFPPERQAIDGLRIPDSDVFYSVLVPIEGIMIGERFSAGQVTFYGPADMTSDDVSLAALLPSESWASASFGARARMVVPARTFVDALGVARTRLAQAIDWLTWRAAYSEAFAPSRPQRVVPLRWDRRNAVGRALASDWTYCRRLAGGATIVWNTGRPRLEQSLVGGWDRLAADWPYAAFAYLFNAPERALSSSERNILAALHWMRRAEHDDRPHDKLIDLWNALESIVAMHSMPALFTDTDKQSVLEGISATVAVTPGQWKRIKESINGLNHRALPERIQEFVMTYEVPLSPRENSILNNTRRKRNDLVHGKTITALADSELRKLSFIVSKMLVRSALALSSDHGFGKDLPRYTSPLDIVRSVNP